MRSVRRRLGVAALATVVVLSAPAAHAQRESGVQCTSDRSGVLINKDVNDESWVITWRARDGYTTGNVITADGGVAFLSCELDSIRDGMVNLQCSSTTACSETSCPGYTPVSEEPIAIPCSFFSAPCSPIPGRPFDSNELTCAGSPPRYPYDSEESCAAFAAEGGCARYAYTPGSCTIVNCCTLPASCP